MVNGALKKWILLQSMVKTLRMQSKNSRNIPMLQINVISSIQQLQNEQMELWEDLVNIPLDEAEEKIDRISNALQGLESAYDTISYGGSGISKLDKQILSDYGITKSEQRLEKAKKNERTQNEKRKKEKEKVDKADKNLKSEQSDLKKRIRN